MTIAMIPIRVAKLKAQQHLVPAEMGVKPRTFSHITWGHVKDQCMISFKTLNAHTSLPRIPLLGVYVHVCVCDHSQIAKIYKLIVNQKSVTIRIAEWAMIIFTVEYYIRINNNLYYLTWQLMWRMLTTENWSTA